MQFLKGEDEEVGLNLTSLIEISPYKFDGAGGCVVKDTMLLRDVPAPLDAATR